MFIGLFLDDHEKFSCIAKKNIGAHVEYRA